MHSTPHPDPRFHQQYIKGGSCLSPLLMGLMLAAGPAGAWGPVGHKTVALIASDRLSPRAREKVAAILGEGVGLDEVALCADDIRKSSTTCAGRFPLAHDKRTSPWHYIDIPTRDLPTPATLDRYCDKDGADDACVMDQIKAELAVLASPGASTEDRRRALIFVVHFVGDVHQPLHCATEVTRAGKSDHGGNLKWVALAGAQPGGRKMNLHALWDAVLRTDPKERGPGPRALADRLEKDLADKDLAPWLEGDVVVRAVLESHAIAKDVIYPEYHKNYGKPIGKYYQDKHRPIAYERLQRAGVRLSHLLEQALQ